MDVQLLEQLVALSRLQSYFLITMATVLVIGIAVLGWELYGITKALQGIAVILEGVTRSVENVARMTTEILRRTPER